MRSLVQRAIQKAGGPKGFYDSLTPAQRDALPYQWEAWARPNQLPPSGSWRFWLARAGRGFGKTRSGAEWIRKKAKEMPGAILFLVAETPAQGRDVMVKGPAGLLACCPAKERPLYEPSKRLLTWPLVKDQPTTAQIYSARNHEELRGPQCHAAWLDELAKWKYGTEAFDNLNLGLRLGEHPQAFITTTPRAVTIMRRLAKDPRCIITRGSTFDNAANLARDFLDDVRAKYEGTRLGRQELFGEQLEDTPGALWRMGPMIDAFRKAEYPYAIGADNSVLLDEQERPLPDLDKIVVGVDPSVADPDDEEEDDSGIAECGIVVCGRKGMGLKARYYVLEDGSIRGSPDEWSKRVIQLYRRWKANLVVAEINNGGALVELALRQVDPRVKYKAVTASRGKMTRAEPISMMYEQGRVHHVGTWNALEDQMCSFVPGQKSPDRMDAMVWSMTELSQEDDAKERLRRMLG